MRFQPHTTHLRGALAAAGFAAALSLGAMPALAQQADKFGIVTTNFDASGPDAFPIKPGQLIAYIQSGMAYDSPADANYITVADAATHEILGQFAVPMPEGYQSHGLGASADGKYLYIPSLPSASRLLHVLDGRTMKLAQTIDVGARTHHVDEGTYKQTDKFIMVDTDNPAIGALLLDPNNENAVIGGINAYTVSGRAYSAWSDPSGNFAYLTMRSPIPSRPGWISKVDLKTLKQVQAYEVGYGAVWVAFSADGKTAWVTNTGSVVPVKNEPEVMEIAIGQDGAKDEVVAAIPLPMAPYGIVLSADGKKLYVVGKTYVQDPGNTKLYVVDTETKSVIKEITVGVQPDHVFLSPDGAQVWVAENRGNQVTIVDTATDEIIGTIPAPGDVHSVRFVQY
ncbi:MAG: hypothetical protein K0B00_01835 [Rhodobacteraceae bacterium]|nr:hypothetical protein [Paracoccaceae bacterium]